MEQLASQGLPVTGHLHSADATTAAAIPLFVEGAARTLQAGERLVIDFLKLVTADGGDFTVFLDNDNDNVVDTGEVLDRGTYGATGGFAHAYPERSAPKTAAGRLPHVIAASAGVVDVTLFGRILNPIAKSLQVGNPS